MKNEIIESFFNKDKFIDISSLQKYFIFTFKSNNSIVFRNNDNLHFIFDDNYKVKEKSKIVEEVQMMGQIKHISSVQEIMTFLSYIINKNLAKSNEIVIRSNGNVYNNIIYLRYKDSFVKFSNVENKKILDHVVGNTDFHCNSINEYDPDFSMIHSFSIFNPYSYWNECILRKNKLIEDFYLEKK